MWSHQTWSLSCIWLPLIKFDADLPCVPGRFRLKYAFDECRAIRHGVFHVSDYPSSNLMPIFLACLVTVDFPLSMHLMSVATSDMESCMYLITPHQIWCWLCLQTESSRGTRAFLIRHYRWDKSCAVMTMCRVWVHGGGVGDRQGVQDWWGPVHTATHCTLQHCNTLQRTARLAGGCTNCNTLQTATLQPTAPHYNAVRGWWGAVAVEVGWLFNIIHTHTHTHTHTEIWRCPVWRPYKEDM